MTNRLVARGWKRVNQLRFSSLDFKVGFRMLARYPGISVVGTLAIAVAIALGTLYFEALNKWENPRLPIENADRVVTIRAWDVNAARPEGRLLNDFASWRGQLRTVENLGAAIPFTRNLATADGRVEPVVGAEITPNAFGLAQTAPLLGRTLTDRDAQPAEPPVVVIGYAVWNTRFARDPQILGKTLKLGTATATIVGVMPEGFGFPVAHQVWTPLRLGPSTRTGPTTDPLLVFGRLAPGVTLNEAQAELTTIGR